MLAIVGLMIICFFMKIAFENMKTRILMIFSRFSFDALLFNYGSLLSLNSYFFAACIITPDWCRSLC